MPALLRDALRQVVRSRRFTLAAALCAALGVASFGAVGALLDAAFVAPLPFRDTERLQRVWMTESVKGAQLDLSVPEAEAVIERVGAFESVAASARVRIVGRFSDGAHRMRGEAVSDAYFETLGLRAALGRTFRPDERDVPVALLSHGLWLSRFGGDPNVVGRTLATAQGDFAVVGVMPAWFHGAIEPDEVELWVPFSFAGTPAQRADRARRHVWIAGRMKDGTTEAAARAEIDALTAALHAEDSSLPRTWRLELEPFAANWRAPLRRTGGLLGAAAAALLVVAIANAAALLAVRARERRHELALRGALGASSRRLATQLLVESLLVIGAGGLAGLAAAWPILDLFLAINPGQLPPYVAVAPNAIALTIGLALALLLGGAAGTLPALEGLAARPLEALRAGGRAAIGAGSSRRSSRALVALQLAATLVLLVGATLVLRSYAALAAAPLGFETERILRLAVTPARVDLAPDGEPLHLSGLVERLRARIAAVPGVESVGFVAGTLPPWDGWRPRLLGIPGAPEEGFAVGGHPVEPALIETLGIELVAGRLPTAEETRSGARVAAVSVSLARILANGERAGAGEPEAALGRAVRFAPGDDVEGELTVIGVVADAAWGGTVDQETQRFLGRDATRADLYFPLELMGPTATSIAVRTAGPPAAAERAVREAIASVAPSSPIHWVSEMSDELAAELRPARFLALLVDAFAAAALAVAGTGLFGFLAASVASRRRELGLRGALGASRAALVRLVTGEALHLVLPALAIAAAGVALLQPVLGAVLHEVAPTDPAALAAAVGLLSLTAAAALAAPLRTTLAIQPAEALRDE